MEVFKLPNGSIESKAFKTDSEKNLYKKVGEEYAYFKKLPKAVFSLAEYENTAYFIDTFGDCYRIDETDISFLFGILSSPKYFAIENDRIYCLDKYSRMWVHDLDGEMLNISFLKEHVLFIKITESYCLYATDGKANLIEYQKKEEAENQENKESQGNNKSKEEINKVDVLQVGKPQKIFYCNRSFDILKFAEVDKILEIQEDQLTYEKNNKNFAFVL